MKPINQTIAHLKPSGIRKYFDLANSMEGVISLGVGEPDFDTPWHISAKAVESFEDGHTHYTANRGLIALRKQIAGYYHSRYGIDYDPQSEILVTVGGSEAVDLCCRTLISPGDEVIVLDPNYVAYEPAILMAGGVPVRIELTQDNDFKLLPEDLERAINDHTKAIILNFPSNPTGGVMTREDYERVVPILKESGIYVISDEIYSELLFEGEFCSPANFEQIRDQVLVINGFSKAFAMTGWRVGYLCGPEPLLSVMLKIHQYSILCAPRAGQVAATEALRTGRENGYEDVIKMRESYDRRRRLMVEGFRSMGLDCFEPLGAFYVFPSIKRTGLTSEDFCTRLLSDKKVACVPGTAFGACGEGHIRCSYATGIDKLNIALDKMSEFVKGL